MNDTAVNDAIQKRSPSAKSAASSGAVTIGGTVVKAGTKQQLEIPVARLATQTMLSLPVTVVRGKKDGPSVWLSAAIHGDELNGVEIIRQVLQRVSPKTLRGTLIAVPIVNVFGFIEQSRYLPDRRDLNRSFPGSPRGSLAGRLAHLFITEIVSQSTHGIDLHTASHHRTNLPQIRADLSDRETHRCALAFGAPLTIQASTRDGSLRQAAARRGIPVLLYEAGEALRFDPDAIRIGVDGVLRVLCELGACDRETLAIPEPETQSLEIDKTQWVRASRSGIFRRAVNLGDAVTPKQTLGVIGDAFGDRQAVVKAPQAGIIAGLALNPLVNRGDGIVHIALTTPSG